MGRFALDPEAAALLDTGVALVIGTANAARVPEICRGWGPRWNAGEGALEALLPLPAAERTIRNLSEAPSIALTFSTPTDYSAYQLKGDCAALLEPEAHHWRRARHHFDAFLIEAASVGLAPRPTRRGFPPRGAW